MARRNDRNVDHAELSISSACMEGSVGQKL